MLNFAELRSLGIKVDYGAAVSRAGIEFVHYPIVEGAGAGDHNGTMQAAHAVVASAVSVLQRGENSVMHCRGGVGRAGMMAACVLLFTREAATPKQAIGSVRKRRCKQAVETRRQEDFVKRYHAWLIETGVLDAAPNPGAAPGAAAAAISTPEEDQICATAGQMSAAAQSTVAEKRRQQVKERRDAARASAKVVQNDGSTCSGKSGCTCAACAMSAAVLGGNA